MGCRLGWLLNSLGITNWHDAGVEYGDDSSSPMVDAYRGCDSKWNSWS
jgi:hypothetical protein